MLTTGQSELAGDPFVEAMANAVSELFAVWRQTADKSVKILVAFSGGPDSTALLFGLAALKVRFNLDLYACHINHGMREEAKVEEEFCRSVCLDLGIPLKVEVLPKLSSHAEDSLRNARYEKLSACAFDWDCSICVTGHTADDQAETILFRLFRGTYPGGVLGIPAWRWYRPDLVLMRPLLQLTHADCRQYLDRLKIVPCLDSSNMEISYNRNYIRHKVMPVIEERFPGFAERLLQFSSLIEADERYISGEVEEAYRLGERNDFELDVNKLTNMPLALRRRIMVRSLIEHEIEPNFKRMEAVLEMLESDKDSVLSLSKRWDLKVSRGRLSWIDKEAVDESSISEFEFELNMKGLTLIAPLNMAVGFSPISLNRGGGYPEAHELHIVADLSSISPPLTLRWRRPGDRIQPLGMQSIVRLKKFLHTHKSADTLTFAGQTVVLADQDEVLWVPGCGISQKIAVKTKPTHKISINKLAADPVLIG